MNKQETRLFVLAVTEQQAYEFVYNGQSKESFLQWLAKHHNAAKFGLTLQEILKWAGSAYDLALEEKNDPAKNWEEIFGQVMDGVRGEEQNGLN